MNNKNIKELIKALTPKQEYRENMFYEIIEKNKNENKKKVYIEPTKRFRPAILTTMVILLLTTTALATVYLGLDAKFLSFLKPSSNEQAEFLANGAYVVDKQISNKNGTLDIKQVIGDSNLTYILMDFTAPEGTVLDASRYRFGDTNFDLGSGWQSTGFSLINDENPGDNKISIVANIMTKNSVMGEKLSLKLANLQGADPFPGEFKTVINGTWKTSFRLDFKECSTINHLNKNISMFGYDAMLKSVSVSPISISLKIESPSIKDIDKASGGLKEVGLNEYLDNYPITINYKDGTSETTTIFTGMCVREFVLEETTIIKTFDNVINHKEIESIEFFDTIISLSN